MKAKKFAVRALIILAVVVAVCMFFSGTIRTIATAKVKIVSVRQGKLVQKVELAGKLVFPASEKVYISGATDVGVVVASVKVLPGYRVAAGDVIFSASVADFEKTMAQLRSDYTTAEQQLQTLARKGIKLRRTDELWAQAYAELTDRSADALDAKFEVETLLRLEGLKPAEDGTAPAGASDALLAAYEKKVQADSALAAAQAQMDDADRYSVDEDTRSYITEKKKLEDQMDTIEAQILELNVLNAQLKTVTAQQDGYITEINVKAGETFDPANAAYSIATLEQLPVLRADISQSKLTITKGMGVTFLDKDNDEVDSTVSGTGITLTGEKYADIELTEEILEDMGGAYAMTLADTAITVEYKARQATTLLPASAVRGSGDDRYVFVIRQEQSAFGTNKSVLSKVSVKVLAQADSIISVEEDLSYEQVAYMEDRPVAENSVVMEYTE